MGAVPTLVVGMSERKQLTGMFTQAWTWRPNGKIKNQHDAHYTAIYRQYD
jgi:hypothetical protein